MMNLLLLIISAYIIGSVPTAYWIGKIFFDIDIREHGSKNMGASNSFRVFGAWWGTVVLLIDLLKGVTAVQLAQMLQPGDWLGSEKILWQLLFGLIAVFGHIFPLFAGFRGGKGVATLFGVVLAIQPWTALISIAAFVLVVFLTKYISLGSMIAAVTFMICVWFAFKETNVYLRWFSIITAVMVIVNHRSNLARLLKGSEKKFSFPKRDKKKES